MNFFRDTWIEVDLDAIAYNTRELKRHYVKEKKLIAVVKANAYGHGSIMVARTVVDAGAEMLAVATLDEAIELRHAGIRVGILVLGVIPIQKLIHASTLNISVTIHSLAYLNSMVAARLHMPLSIHLKLDTGMHRIGLQSLEEIRQVLKVMERIPGFKLTGVYSHLATSDDEDDAYYHYQLTRFNEMVEAIGTKGLIIHLSNSAGAVKFEQPTTNGVRMGLMLYGLSPSPTVKLRFELKQAIGLYTKLIQCKQLEVGRKVSYHGDYETKENEWIGTLGIGYADGFDPRMSKGRVYVDGDYAQVVGRVCMDQCLIKLPHEKKEGTIVELIGPHCTVDEVASWLGTINYHVLCQLSDRLQRVYKMNGRIHRIINRRLE